MGQIGNTILYPYDVVISTLDFLTGTDSNDNKKTKSYQIKKLAEIINIVNGGSAVAYHFSDGSNIDLTVLEPGYFFSETNIITPATLTKLHFNKRTIENKDISVFLDKMIASGLFKFKLNNLSNPNNFIYLTPSNTVLSTEYLSFNVAAFNNLHSGNLINNADYVLSFDLTGSLVPISDPLKLNRGNYTGTGEDLNKEIQDLKNPDVVLKSVTPTIVGLNISTLADSFEWRINQIVFDNTPALSQTLLAASNGFYRKDVLLGTNTNTYLIVRGVEGNESVTPPTVFPQGTIVLGIIDIFGNTTSGFIINDNSKVDVFGNGGVTDYVEVNKLGTSLDIRNATSLTGFTIPSANIQYGKDYYLRNSTGGNLTLRSITGTNGIRFYFPDGDLVVPVNNNVHLKYLSNTEFGGLGYFTLVGISYKDKVDKNTNITPGTATKITYDAKGLVTNGVNLISSDIPTIGLSQVSGLPATLSGKADKETGKSLILDTEITRISTLVNYTHPVSHLPSIITQDAGNRFVTDAEKAAWNAKQNALGFTPENVANKQNSLVVDGTGVKFPTVDAVNADVVKLTLNQIIPSQKTFSPTVNPTLGFSKGLIISPTSTATANDNTLIGLDVTTNFNASTFTGVNKIAIKTTEKVVIGREASPFDADLMMLTVKAPSDYPNTYFYIEAPNNTYHFRIDHDGINGTTGTDGDWIASAEKEIRFTTFDTGVNTYSEKTHMFRDGSFSMGAPFTKRAKLTLNGGEIMTGGYTRNLLTSASYPSIVLESTTPNKSAAISYDGSANTGGLSFFLNATTIDATASALTSGPKILFTNEGDLRVFNFQGATNRLISANVEGKLVATNTVENVNLTGTPTAPTATAGSNGLQIANKDYVTTADAGNVKLTGNQTIEGIKTFNNGLSGQSSIIVNTQSGGGGAGAIAINNSNANFAILIQQTRDNSTSAGVLINNTGSSQNFISNQTATGTGFNYVGQNNGANTFTVNKLGAITAQTATLTNLSGTGLRSVAADATGNVIARTTYPIFESNAAAVSLAIGEFYRTSTGILMVRF